MNLLLNTSRHVHGTYLRKALWLSFWVHFEFTRCH